MDYWQKQGKKALFSEIDTERPERRQLAGRLLIIGGSKMSFFGVAGMASKAAEVGISEIKVLLPDSLKKQVPVGADVIFAPSESSGGFSAEAIKFAVEAAENADFVLLAGDMGKNAETATFAERFMTEETRPVLLTRDAVELLTGGAGEWLERSDVILYATLPQLQKVFRAVYYPKMITLSMPTNQLVETLHKFTVTYPVSLMSYHNEQIVVARGGRVVSTELSDTSYNPINLWSGELAVKIAALRLWNEGKDFEVAVTAVLM